MMVDREAYDAEYRRRRRARLVAQGLCTSCGKKPMAEGLLYCAECRDRNRAKKRARLQRAREQGMCMRCLKVKARPGYTMCMKCACNESARRDLYYWRKKAMKAEVNV